MSPDSKDIKFPATHYVGFQTRPSEDGVPLGFMTPDGTDAAAKKRKDTVDSWARGYGYSAKNEGALPAKTLENKPMNGFKLGRSLRHGGGGWGQGNVKWRIEDPRGFELEITSPNLAQIMSCTTIENGEILEQCMWARLKADNVLVPVSSEVYKTAQANTERLNKSASLAELNLGDHAVLLNAVEGTYLGAYFFGEHGIHRYNISEIKWSDKKKHLFLQKDGTIYVVASPKLSEIRPTDKPLTPEAAEQKVIDHIVKRKRFESAGYAQDPQMVSTVGGKKVMKVELISEEVPTAPFLTNHKETFMLLVETPQAFGIVNSENFNSSRSYWGHSGGEFSIQKLDQSAFLADGSLKPVQEEIRGYGWGSSSRLQNKHVQAMKADLKPTVRKIRVRGTTALGNVIDYHAY